MGWTRQEVLAVARSTGRPVVEAWSDHDAGEMGTVLGPMLHHTGSVWSYPRLTAPTLRTVREGRSDLQNALCMYYIDYEGVIYCVTEKIAWHAGGGSWQGITDGNGHYAGIEAESDGRQWTKPTVASYKHLAAAILRKTGRTVAYAPRHADYALPPGRKTDFSGMDPATFLADVNADLTDSEEFTVAQYDNLVQLIKDNHRDMADAVWRGVSAAQSAEAMLKGNNSGDLNNFHWIGGVVTGAVSAAAERIIAAINGGVKVDPSEVQAAIEAMTAQSIAKAVADEADRRARDGDPATGPHS